MKKTIILTVLAILVLASFGCSRQEPKTGVDMTITPEDSSPGIEDSAMPSSETESDDSEDSTDLLSDSDPVKTSFTGTEITCDEKHTLGYVGCADLGETADLILRNTGRLDIDGALIRYLDSSSNIIDETSEIFSFAMGDQKTFSLSLSDSMLWKVEVFPIDNGNVCINKPLVIIPDTNCR